MRISLAPGLNISPIGFGCMGMTAFYGAAMKTADGLELLRSVHTGGCTHFDTAEIYQQFTEVLPDTLKYNEELVGEFLSTLPRDSFTVATKYFPGLHDGKCDFETVSAAVDASLGRLKLDSIDVYYLHRMPATVDLMEEWMASMKRVVESGRVKHVGLSEAPADWIRRANAVHPVACVQQEWSLLSREPIESQVVPICAELGIGIVAYSPLARNILALPDAEPPADWRAAHPRYQKDNFEANRQLVQQVYMYYICNI